MRLFLIRHGETVDNVAGLYAGSRDSALTNHGIEQARRLGSYLATNKPALTRLFSSPLQRAAKTANALAIAQAADLTTVKVADLVEQDFGYYEGKPFSARSRHSPHKDGPAMVDVESKDSLARRSDSFLDDHLLPLFGDDGPDHVVAVVSHGILLSHLWRRLLLRLEAKSVTISTEVVASRGQLTLEHLGGWSNTGFLELYIQPVPLPSASEAPSTVDVCAKPVNVQSQAVDQQSPKLSARESIHSTTSRPLTKCPGAQPPETQSDPIGDVSLTNDVTKSVPDQKPILRRLQGYRTIIITVDGKHHLSGLKRTRGGIGRAEHDEKQKTVDSFFKKARKE